MTNLKAPLYTILRPSSFDEVVGQEKVVKLLKAFLSQGYLPSMIFFGPPGSGKTTVARIAANMFNAKLYRFSAVKESITEIKKRIYTDSSSILTGKQIVFVDEIHRFNKAQQDSFLPMIEDEGVIFIGATTENPSFYINNALLSRARAVRFSSIREEAISAVLKKVKDKLAVKIDNKLLDTISIESNGDLRVALSILESAFYISDRKTVKKSDLFEFLENPAKYDKKNDYHYRIISAFIKSLRGSDPDAALYYLIKMIDGGEDPLFILRRMIIFASEDVGNADPRALQMAVSALQGFQAVGFPEGRIILGHIVTYLATAPKSNASYDALNKATDFYNSNKELEVPGHLVNDSSKSPEEEKGGYSYPHDFPDHWIEQRYFPGKQEPPVFYDLSTSAYEAKVKAYWEKVKSRD
jgi:putative ATPase